MPMRDAFYDSQGPAPGDRLYSTDAWANLLRRTFSNGVFMLAGGAELQVTETSPVSLAVRVLVGSGMVDGRFGELYDTALALTLATADPTNPRIDTVVLRRDLSAGVRATVIAVKAGTPGVTPAAPALQQDATIYEVALANVAVAAGATSIANANITDRRVAAGATNAAAVAGRVPGAAAGNLPILDTNGRVPNADLLRGLFPTQTGQANQLVQTGDDGKIPAVMLPALNERLTANKSTAQSIGTGDTPITFTEAQRLFMGGTITAPTTSSYRVGTIGYYLVTGMITVAALSSGTDSLFINFTRSGTYPIPATEFISTAGSRMSAVVSGIFFCGSADDTISMVSRVGHARSSILTGMSIQRVG